MNEQRNIILAIAISVAILLGWQYVFPSKIPPKPAETSQTAIPAATPGSSPVSSAPDLPTGPLTSTPAASSLETRAAAIAASPRVRITTPSLNGSFSLIGGRIDDLNLRH